MVAKKAKQKTLEYFFPFIIIISGALALLASIMIMHEGVAALKNPNYSAVCDINPIFSCGSVMKSDQSKAFGFDNTYLGIIGFSALVTIGVSMLAGATYKRWFWQALLAGMTASQAFIFWLMYESVYSIGSLCMFCMLLWATVTAAFWYTFVYTLRKDHIKLPKQFIGVSLFVQRHHLDIIISVYLIIIAIILQHFWYYFGTLV
jgi:uncharacterized membrane protein